MKLAQLAAAVVLILIGAAATLQAGPPDAKLIPADAKWAVHVDVEALLDSSLIQKGIDRWMKEENGQFALAQFKQMFGLDLREDVDSLTIYNAGYKEHEAVLLVSANFDKQKLIDMAKNLPDYKTKDVDSVEVHAWTDRDHGNRTVAGAFASDELLVIASSVQLMERALAVIEGDKPNLEDEPSALKRDVPAGAILVGAVVGLATADVPDKDKLPKGFDEIALAVGERDNQVFLSGRIAAKNEDTATNIREVIEGVRALVLLAHEVDEEAKNYFRDASIEQAGGVVELDVRLPAERVWEAMQKAEAEKKAKHKVKDKAKDKVKDKVKEKLKSDK